MSLCGHGTIRTASTKWTGDRHVEWHDGDVMVLGSSSTGPLQRVFLGSRASRIIRRSRVPVIVVPR